MSLSVIVNSSNKKWLDWRDERWLICTSMKTWVGSWHPGIKLGMVENTCNFSLWFGGRRTARACWLSPTPGLVRDPACHKGVRVNDRARCSPMSFSGACMCVHARVDCGVSVLCMFSCCKNEDLHVNFWNFRSLNDGFLF